MNAAGAVPVAGPEVGSAPGWPLVLYFHHVHPDLDHYTALSPELFRVGLETVLSRVGPAIDPAVIGPGYTPPDEPCVLITFDDGYRDNLERAAPILREFGVRVILFCVTDRLDRGGVPVRAPREDYLDWAAAARFAAEGHVLSAHGRTHRALTALAAERDGARSLAYEVAGSLDRVAARTGKRPRTFAYPYGLVPEEACVPPDVLAFGTVKSPPLPWTRAPHRIRRTYLPTHEPDRWLKLARGWWQQWHESR